MKLKKFTKLVSLSSLIEIRDLGDVSKENREVDKIYTKKHICTPVIQIYNPQFIRDHPELGNRKIKRIDSNKISMMYGHINADFIVYLKPEGVRDGKEEDQEER